RLLEIKRRAAVPDYGWYPYESLSALEILLDLMQPVFVEAAAALASGPVADVGCADGDLGLLCASFGAEVDSIDHLESSFNQMRGVEALRIALDLRVNIHDVDLDGRFDLPRADYGFAFFLGTLYHLKNPYYVLEKLARHCGWCALSTRIARRTPQETAIEREPVAYLLDAREANNDPTNFWIFSAAGLLRLLRRTGWIVMGERRIGDMAASDPARGDHDERMFVLLKSRVRHPELSVRPLHGWHPIEDGAWRWTAKNFGIEVAPPLDGALSEFALRVTAPEGLFAVQDRVRLSCIADGEPAGAITFIKPETLEFRGRFPKPMDRRAIRLDFFVESEYTPGGGDARELGVIVPLLDPSPGNAHRLPFRVS
ncbi:MAG: hypothetical protein ACRD30_05385, partial [Bryobacteraceae bacterium]